VISLIISLVIFLLYNFTRKNLYHFKILTLILSIPIAFFYVILTDDLLCNKVYSKVCSKESLLYRKIYLMRELDVFVHFLPLGNGPGFVSSKFINSEVEDIFFPTLTSIENKMNSETNKKNHNKFFNDKIYSSEIYGVIRGEYFLNHQITPTQEISVFSKLLAQYGILGLMVLIIFFKKLKDVFNFSKISTYFLLIFFFNGLINSTTGLGFVIIICIYLVFTNEDKNKKFI